MQEIDKVIRTQSPASAKSIFKDKEGTLHNITYAQAIEQDILEWNQYAQHLQQSAYWQRLISSDTKTIAVVLTLDIVFGGDNAALRQQVYQDLQRILHNSAFKNYVFSGESELLYRLSYLSEEDLQTLLPLSVVVLCLLLFLLYRQFSFPVVIVVVVLLNLLVTFNLMQLSGLPFNVLSANLPLLVLIIAMADSIHILRRWQANEHIDNIRQRCVLCWQQTWLPCLFTSVTSAIGFGVFSLSEILPLRHFGELSFICIIIAYPVIMLSNMLLLYVFVPQAKQRKNTDKEKKPPLLLCLLH